MLVADILLLAFGLAVFINYFRPVMEVYGYSDFFEFLKYYFFTGNM